MTKKDFELIARVVYAAKFGARGSVEHETIDRLMVHFAYALEQTNIRFDRERFLKACKPD